MQMVYAKCQASLNFWLRINGTRPISLEGILYTQLWCFSAVLHPYSPLGKPTRTPYTTVWGFPLSSVQIIGHAMLMHPRDACSPHTIDYLVWGFLCLQHKLSDKRRSYSNATYIQRTVTTRLCGARLGSSQLLLLSLSE